MTEGEYLAAGAMMSDVDFADFGRLLARPAWHADAACLEHPEVNFYPELGESLEPARAVCHGCAVRSECLTFALDTGEKVGVWGGLSERQRRALRSARTKAPQSYRCERCQETFTAKRSPDPARRILCRACCNLEHKRDHSGQPDEAAA